MTEDLIKQNAKEWVKPLVGKEDGGYNENDVSISLMKNAFIAGAHSRDEEIEELKEEIESLKENEKELFEGFKKRGTKLGELMKENVKLRNPWISVEERLPEEREIINGAVSVDVLVRTKEGWCTIGYYNHELNSWRAIGNVTHWMQIPELKKGE